MRLKLDENLGIRTAHLFAEAGHDVATVIGQGLAGYTDADLLTVCVAEGRAMITLDLPAYYSRRWLRRTSPASSG